MHCSGLAWNSRLSGIQISKLNRRSGPGEGQPDNRKFNEPSATRQTQFYFCFIENEKKTHGSTFLSFRFPSLGRHVTSPERDVQKFRWLLSVYRC